MITAKPRRLSGNAVLLVVLSCAMFSGCAALPEFWGESRTIAKAYDLPRALDPNKVIRAADQVLARRLGVAPRVVEGSVPDPLPNEPANVMVADRVVNLEHLGRVSLPRVICPQFLAVFTAFPSSDAGGSGPDRVTACIQRYAEGYRVHIIGHVLSPGRSGLSGRVVDQIGQDLLDRLADAGSIEKSRDRKTAPARRDRPPSLAMAASHGLPLVGKGGAAHSASAVTSAGQDGGWPLVCLVPRGHGARVRSKPGGGDIVTTLRPTVILAVPEPVGEGYVQITDRRSTRGWVSTEELKKSRCPVG